MAIKIATGFDVLEIAIMHRSLWIFFQRKIYKEIEIY